MINPACEVNEKGKREKNGGNAVLEDGTKLPLDLDANDIVVVDQKTLPMQRKIEKTPSRGRSLRIRSQIRATFHNAATTK